MAKNLFSVPIFFIAFRECLEASLIVAILLGLVEQIVSTGTHSPHSELHHHQHTTEASSAAAAVDDEKGEGSSGSEEIPAGAELTLTQKALIRKLRLQIFLGAGIGLLIALAIGAAFIAVWFTQSSNIWGKSEELWEGIFSLIASLIILVMGLTMLKLDQAKAKWKVKLQLAFEKHQSKSAGAGAKTSRYVLLILPMITVLREGLEAVVFIGGVALGQPATSIPIAAIVGILCGLVCGYIIYQFASHSSLRIFLVIMTNLLLLIGAGLFSKAVGNFQRHAFNTLLGADVDDSRGDGPGSFSVNQSVWHLDCCNPEDKLDSQGWSIFTAILGWTNSATVGTVLAYVFYWIAVIVCLVVMKRNEKLHGRKVRAGNAAT